MAEKKCNNCGTDKALANVPYVVYESAMSQIKSLVWVIVLLILLLVGSNVGWLIYESQFEVVEETTETITYENVEQVTDAGGNNLIGGDIVNGETENRQNDNN